MKRSVIYGIKEDAPGPTNDDLYPQQQQGQGQQFDAGGGNYQGGMKRAYSDISSADANARWDGDDIADEELQFARDNAISWNDSNPQSFKKTRVT